MILKPNRISIDSEISLIAPAGVVSQEKIQKSILNIQKLQLIANDQTPNRQNYGYLAQPDEKRIEELNNSFLNSTNAIFCIRGGYGTTRILNKINYNSIKQNPKIFVGFSDITGLQSAFYEETKLVSIHGIVASSNFSEYTINQLNNLIFRPEATYNLPLKTIKILNHGKAEGRIVGGNLSVLTSLIGTKYLYKFINKIVFIEDVSEPPYKIDKMLNHLLMATDIRAASAIVFGQFNNCEPENFNQKADKSLRIEQILKQNFSNLKIPIIFDVNFGHIDDALIFPIGIKTFIDTKQQIIKLIEKTTL